MGYTSCYDLAHIKILITWKFNELLPLNYSSPLMELVVILSTILIITICDNLGEEGTQLSVVCSKTYQEWLKGHTWRSKGCLKHWNFQSMRRRVLDTYLWNMPTLTSTVCLSKVREDKKRLSQPVQRKNKFLKETACHLSLSSACYKLQNE